jgi:glucoamylase
VSSESLARRRVAALGHSGAATSHPTPPKDQCDQTVADKVIVPERNRAPGKPGFAPSWTAGQKDGVGTARSLESHVWFTLARGILDAVYYPRVDRPAVKDMGMLVTDGRSFFADEPAGTDTKVTWLGDGVPGFRVTNTCREGRFVVEKTFVADPNRHVVLQETRFVATRGTLADYHLYVLLAPHLDNQGRGDNARVGDFKGVPMLLADHGSTGLALASTAPWLNRSAGYVGTSDGWQDLHRHGRMTWAYDAADDGNVALTGEIDLTACGGAFTLALGFGHSAAEAGHRARASLDRGFDAARDLYARQWTAWHESLRPLPSGSKANSTAYRVSATVVAVHESKDFQGGTVASLSFPWGAANGDGDEGGYHLVWPRDAGESAGALMAAGATAEVIRALEFFQTTQEGDGRWPQNMWMDGTGFWTGVQLDEVAAPILLLDLARRNERVCDRDVRRFWPMVRQAVGYVVRHGPSSPQDRWEEDAGLTAFTLASMIAALLIAADMADDNDEAPLGTYLRETADAWNDSIERWTYVQGTDLAKGVGVEGYYVRIAPPGRLSMRTSLQAEAIKIPNLDGDGTFPVDQIVSVDALALVRFGLRDANDPRMLNTVRVIDAVLKVDTPLGPAWHRYNHDGYGEKADGSPFQRTGVGRCWPLFAGERAHYELAAGSVAAARHLLGVLESMAGVTGLISEQVWDSAPMPARRLCPGRPSGSAQPLVWAHAEHVKLIRSLADGAVFDMPPQTVKRYLKDHTRSPHRVWRFEGQVGELPHGTILRIETLAAARVHWTPDGWATAIDAPARDTGVGLYATDLPTAGLSVGTAVVFTFYWTSDDRWEESDFTLAVTAAV